MVSFTPNEEQQLLIDTINKYAEKTVRPVAHESDEGGAFPDSAIKAGWQLGLVPSGIPEELGGFGELSAVTNVLALEELAYGDLSLALHLMTPALFAYPVVLFGTAEQRSEYLPLFLDEAFAPATAALLEPGVFFDAHDLKTTVGGDGKLNGVKAYVPLADSAQHILVYAKNTQSGEIEAYIVARDAAGVSIEKPEALMGLRALPTYRVNFADVTPISKLGGAVGINYQTLLNRQQIALAALATGVGRASFEYARDYAKQRVQFGQPIATKQSIAFMLAEMAIEIDATRLMTWEAAWRLDRGEDVTREAYLAKQYADKMALLGGYGFIREYPAERWLRNGRGFPTFHGLAMV
jgi:acyl-CoA dehydrogenase